MAGGPLDHAGDTVAAVAAAHFQDGHRVRADDNVKIERSAPVAEGRADLFEVGAHTGLVPGGKSRGQTVSPHHETVHMLAGNGRKNHVPIDEQGVTAHLGTGDERLHAYGRCP
jgi:hypothetical protein